MNTSSVNNGFSVTESLIVSNCFVDKIKFNDTQQFEDLPMVYKIHVLSIIILWYWHTQTRTKMTTTKNGTTILNDPKIYNWITVFNVNYESMRLLSYHRGVLLVVVCHCCLSRSVGIVSKFERIFSSNLSFHFNA